MIVLNRLIVLAVILALCSSCEKTFLERTDPATSNVENFYKTEKDFELALNGVYNVLIRSDYYQVPMWQLTDVRSDDGGPGDDLDYVTFAGDAIDNFYEDAEQVSPLNLFATSYMGISRANTLIGRLDNAEISEESKNRFRAESSFLRALFYFNLVRLFGDVPFISKEITNPKDAEVGRTPLLEVYTEGIIPDLIFAEMHLPIKWDGVDKGRASKYAATALLAKVYLTLGELDMSYYRLARDKSLEVIQSNQYSLQANFSDLFKTEYELGMESIFEIQFIAGPGSGYHFEGFGTGVNQPQRQGEGSYFNAFFMPRFQGKTYAGLEAWTFAGWGFNIPTTTYDVRQGYDGVPLGTGIVEAFEERDLRRNVTILDYRADAEARGIAINESLSPYNVNKYRDWQNSANGESDDNYYILRLADVFLMFAEAENEINQGPTPDAYFYLNQVRSRAGLENIEGGLNYTTFLDAVYEERRLELAFEGQRWFDLIRRPQRALDAMQAQGKDLTFERLVFAIPQIVIDQSNGLISQNPGY